MLQLNWVRFVEKSRGLCPRLAFFTLDMADFRRFRCRVVSSIAAWPRCGLGGKTNEAQAKLDGLFSCLALEALLA